MPATPTGPTARNAHETTETLLPWYANGSLSAGESATVEQHLARCPACRAELERCRALANTIQQDAEDGWTPTPGHFDRLLAEIDRLDARPASVPDRLSTDGDGHLAATARDTPPPAIPTDRPTLIQRIYHWLETTPNPVRWTLGLESLAVAALLLVVLLPGGIMPATSDYETLSRGDPAPGATGPRLRLIFNDSATALEIQQLLREIDGAIVAGPTALGIYTIALAKTPRSEHPLAETLNRLRARPQIRLVEAVSPGDSR